MLRSVKLDDPYLRFRVFSNTTLLNLTSDVSLDISNERVTLNGALSLTESATSTTNSVARRPVIMQLRNDAPWSGTA